MLSWMQIQTFNDGQAGEHPELKVGAGMVV